MAARVRGIHSFPTRRSSDLSISAITGADRRLALGFTGLYTFLPHRRSGGGHSGSEAFDLLPGALQASHVIDQLPLATVVFYPRLPKRPTILLVAGAVVVLTLTLHVNRDYLNRVQLHRQVPV